MDIGKNHGKTGRQCYACKNEEETSEHITTCRKVHEMTETTNIEWNSETMSDSKQLNKIYTLMLMKKYINCRENDIKETTLMTRTSAGCMGMAGGGVNEITNTQGERNSLKL